MKVLLYMSPNGPVGNRIYTVLNKALQSGYLEIYNDIAGLKKRLCKSICDVGIAVLVAATQRELIDIISIRTQLSGLRIVLVLPDREKSTITQAHTLYPRFLTYADCDFSDLQLVVKKMTDHSSSYVPGENGAPNNTSYKGLEPPYMNTFDLKLKNGNIV